MSAKVFPSLWFDHNAAEAVDFYTALFVDSAVNETIWYPTEGLADFQQGLAGQVLTIDFTLRDLQFTAINAGPEFKPNQAVSFMVNFDPSHDDAALKSLNELWEGLLADGGSVMMPLGKYPFSERYGWVQDKYGYTWQLILTDPAGDPRPTIIPSLLFGGANQNRAAAATSYYLAQLPGGETGATIPYAQQSGPATPGSVMFSDFKLWDQWFVAMDSAVEQDFTFNESLSFVVQCEDQAEIDLLWGKLSHYPESEQCGWCKDKFGLSWQIVPRNMGELMARPDAFQNLMQMKKLIIADF